MSVNQLLSQYGREDEPAPRIPLRQRLAAPLLAADAIVFGLSDGTVHTVAAVGLFGGAVFVLGDHGVSLARYLRVQGRELFHDLKGFRAFLRERGTRHAHKRPDDLDPQPDPWS